MLCSIPFSTAFCKDHNRVGLITVEVEVEAIMGEVQESNKYEIAAPDPILQWVLHKNKGLIFRS